MKAGNGEVAGIVEKLRALNRDEGKAALLQFIKFGIVGVSNTAISYGMEMLFFYVLLARSTMPQSAKVMLTSAAAFVVSVTNSYFWNNRYVFGNGAKKRLAEHARAYFRTMLCYAVTGLALSPAIKMWLVGMGVPFYAASLASLAVTIPLNFVLNKFWAFRG